MSVHLLRITRAKSSSVTGGRGPVILSMALVVGGWLLLAGPLLAGNRRRTPVVDVVEKVRDAVVNIHSERTVRGPATEELFSTAPSQNRINGMGTGVLVDPRGFIVTNEHVVENVNLIRVRLTDGATYSARVLARDQETDLALLKIDAGRPLPTILLGTAKDLMVGETVIAIGNAYGYEHTVTVGVVSALDRDVTLNKEVSYKALIQTDASINPGNSGGPLLNINGEMIGLNVAIRAGAQGISFAIPVDTMIRVAAEMLSVRRQQSTWHGLVCRNRLDPAPRSLDHDGDSEGLVRSLVVVRAAPASPAARAGAKSEDVILQVGNSRVHSTLDLERALLGDGPGEHVALLVRRQGSEKRLDLVLQSADQETPLVADLVWRKLGLRLSPVSGELSSSHPQIQGGMAVIDMNPEGAAAKAGIQRDDILIGLDHWKTLSLDNVAFVLTHKDLANFNPLVFYIVRSGELQRGWFQQVE